MAERCAYRPPIDRTRNTIAPGDHAQCHTLPDPGTSTILSAAKMAKAQQSRARLDLARAADCRIVDNPTIRQSTHPADSPHSHHATLALSTRPTPTPAPETTTPAGARDPPADRAPRRSRSAAHSSADKRRRLSDCQQSAQFKVRRAAHLATQTIGAARDARPGGAPT